MDPEKLKHFCLYCGLAKRRAEGCVHCGPTAPGLDVQPQIGWLPPGTILNNAYLVGRVLGAGGFGITYLAVDISLETRVAVKEYLPRGLAARAHDQATVCPYPDQGPLYAHGKMRFLDEGRILARFADHPHVVSVVAYFEQHGTAYLVMRYLEGVTLAQYAAQKGGVLPEHEAVALILPVLRGLRDIHKAGLLHRDIKPHNIYLTGDGQVKLLDFGSARYALVERSKTLTTILTPGYAPPEMYDQRGDVGEWTDVYSTAASLYQLLTGHEPPDAFSRVGQDRLTPPAQVQPRVSRAVSDAVIKAMSLDTSRRFRSVDTFMEALSAASEKRRGGPRGTLKRWDAVTQAPDTQPSTAPSGPPSTAPSGPPSTAAPYSAPQQQPQPQPQAAPYSAPQQQPQPQPQAAPIHPVAPHAATGPAHAFDPTIPAHMPIQAPPAGQPATGPSSGPTPSSGQIPSSGPLSTPHAQPPTTAQPPTSGPPPTAAPVSGPRSAPWAPISGPPPTAAAKPPSAAAKPRRVWPIVLSILGIAALITGVALTTWHLTRDKKEARGGASGSGSGSRAGSPGADAVKVEQACKAIVRKNQECDLYIKSVLSAMQMHSEARSKELPVTVRAIIGGGKAPITYQDKSRQDIFGGTFVTNCKEDFRSASPKMRAAIGEWAECAKSGTCALYTGCITMMLNKVADGALTRQPAKPPAASRASDEIGVPECDRMMKLFKCLVEKMPKDARAAYEASYQASKKQLHMALDSLRAAGYAHTLSDSCKRYMTLYFSKLKGTPTFEQCLKQVGGPAP